MVRLECAEGLAGRSNGWLRGLIVGLCCCFEYEIGVAVDVLEKALAVVLSASLWDVAKELVVRGKAFERLRRAGLLDIAIICIFGLCLDFAQCCICIYRRRRVGGCDMGILSSRKHS